jgi:hypothetical protein
MARADSGAEVWRQDFLNLDLPDRRFHGVFANAALSMSPAGRAGVATYQPRDSSS